MATAPLVDISISHLRHWLVVVEEGSVTAAAQRLSISQPALSQQLRTLERRLGGPLVERVPGGVQPTLLGRAVLRDARAAIVAADRLARQARSVVALDAGVLEIATLPSLVDATLLDALRRWHELHPEVAVKLHEYPLASEMARSVAAGVGDVAIGVRPPAWRGPVASLGWEQFMVLLPPQDPLAGEPVPLDLGRLADRNWVLYDPANGLADYVTAACAQSGFRPREAVSTSQVQAAARLAAAGVGPALVPSHNVPLDLAPAARPLVPPIVWELTAYTRTVLSSAAAAFVELLRKRDWFRPPDDAVTLPM